MNNAERRIYNTLAPCVAWHLWQRSEPIQGTLAERYLRETLRLTGLLPETLGYCHSAWCDNYEDYTPSLIAPVHDGGEIVAVSQTFLCPDTLGPWRTLDGRPIVETFGSPGTGACWLAAPDTVLGLAPSVEAALAASQEFSLPVWSTGGASRLAGVWIPPEVEELVIFADGRAAHEAQIRYRATVRQVTVQSIDVRAAA